MSAFCVVRAMMRSSDSAGRECQPCEVSRTRQGNLTVSDDLPCVVERLDEPADSSSGSKDVLLNLLRAVCEKDAEELEREEAKVEVRRREELQESVQGCRRSEEDVRVAQARVVADRLDAAVVSLDQERGAEGSERTRPSTSSTSQSRLSVSTTALAISVSSAASSSSTPRRIGRARAPTSCGFDRVR